MSDNLLRIPLTRGLFTIVDEEDYEYLMQWKWHANQQGCNFYAARTQEKIMMHNEIWQRMGGAIINSLVIDHENRRSLDNRRFNLRQVTYAVNAANSIRHKELTGIGYRGDEYDLPWRVRLQLEKKRIHIGVYRTKDEAIAALQEAQNAYSNT